MSDIDTTYLHVKHRIQPTKPTLEPLSAWQRVWFELRRRPFRRLAVVPVEPEAASLYVANALHEVGRVFEGHDLSVLDATGASLGSVRELLPTLEPLSPTETRLIALDSPLYRPAAMPLAEAADAALLVVTLGRTLLPRARKVVDLLGPARFLGAVAVPARLATEAPR